jgi:hypothetical protein
MPERATATNPLIGDLTILNPPKLGSFRIVLFGLRPTHFDWVRSVSAYAARLWASKSKSVHRRWSSSEGNSYHMSALSSSTIWWTTEISHEFNSNSTPNSWESQLLEFTFLRILTEKNAFKHRTVKSPQTPFFQTHQEVPLSDRKWTLNDRSQPQRRQFLFWFLLLC